MKKIFFLSSLIVILAGCTKEAQVGDLAPEKSFRGNSRGEIIRSEIIKVGDEEIQLVHSYYSEEGVTESVATRTRTGERIGKITHRVQGDFLELIAIESAPCMCDPECFGYNQSLCDWWTCVDEFIGAHDSELLVLTVVCPECGAGALAAVGLHCAQAGSLIISN